MLTALLAGILATPADRLGDEVGMAEIETWNSLMHIELVVSLEERFGVLLDGDEIAEMRSVGAIRAVLARHGIAAA